MVRSDLLLGKIAQHGFNKGTLSKALRERGFRVNRDTLAKKLKSGKFDCDMAQALVEILQIENPAEIFFAK